MEIIVILLLILFNGFFSLSEIVLVSSKKLKLKQMASHSKGARLAIQLKDHSESFLSAIQIGITLIGIITGAYGTMNFADYFVPILSKLPFVAPYAKQAAIFLVIVIVTYISIVIGELVPKSIGLSNPEKIACFVAPVIYFVSKIFKPLVKMLALSTMLVTKILHIKKPNEQITEEEIKLSIESAADGGIMEEHQEIMHNNLFYFADKRAKHIMTHRCDVEWIDINSSIEEIDKELLQMQHSCIVCCESQLDNVLGFIKVKDYLLLKTLSKKDIDIYSLLTQPIIFSENTDANKVLESFRATSTHFACILNEYGGFEGIITLFDILENIVGAMPEKGDDSEPDVFERPDGSFLVSGNAPIEVLHDILDGYEINFDEIDYSTVAGFVFSYLDSMPEVGSSFVFLGYVFEVADTDEKRIDKVLIYKKQKTIEAISKVGNF